MKLLFRSIATLVGLAVLASLVFQKVAETFPAMDALGWAMAGALFVVMVFLAIQLDNWVARRPWVWINANEERRQYLMIITVGVLVALTIYLAWGALGPHLAAHFGSPSRE
ncbi:MAG TPA: hypothetical protein VMV35_11230 [Halothiobacillus sp.]|nr:hypothetical protein [Halothiobacillus sp.]